MNSKLPLIALALALSGTAAAQTVLPYTPSVDPVSSSQNYPLAAGTPSPGLTLYNPMFSTTTYLIDELGGIVHTWLGGNNAFSVYMLENGNLLRTQVIGGGPGGGGTGRVQEVTWDNVTLWSFDQSNASLQAHHDVEYLPNGNVLMIVWEYMTAAEAIANGRDPGLLAGGTFSPDKIIEIQPDGLGGATIVWEWHVWDHLIQDFDNTQANFGVVADHPELFNVNYPPNPTNDWNHFNAVDYHAGFDQIALSSPLWSEIYVIDHSTTTAEAAGHTGGNSGKGGDILYRWGNPEAYGAGTAVDKQLFGQHDIQWIEEGRPGAGNFICFNNGANRPAGPFSSIDEFVSPVDAFGNYAHVAGTAYGPAAPIWIYTDPIPTSFYSNIISGTERLENGNTLVTNGVAGHMFEVNPAKSVVWQYTNPFPGGTNWVFRSRRYNLCEAASYCSAGVSKSGCQATLSSVGMASATAASGFVVSAANVEGNKNGQFYWGVNGRQANAWGNGTSFRCVVPPTKRGGVQTGVGTNGACDGTFSQDLNTLWQTVPAKNPGLGAQVQLQLWYRDPQSTSTQSTSFSDALEFVVCP
jgi:hypothetical protein